MDFEILQQIEELSRNGLPETAIALRELFEAIELNNQPQQVVAFSK